MFHRRPHSFIPSFIIILLLVSVVYVLYLNNTLQSKVSVIETKAHMYKTQHQSLSSQLKVISEKRSMLKNSLDQAEAARAELNDEMQQNKEVHDTIVEELRNKHESKYQSLLEQHGDVKEELNKAKQELDEIKDAKELLEQKSFTHQEIAQSQERKRKILEEENKKLQVQYNQLSEQHKRNNEFLHHVNSRLQTTEEEVQTYNKLKNVLQQAGIHALDLQHSRFNEMSDADRQLLLSHLTQSPAFPGQRLAQQPQMVGGQPNQVVQNQQQENYEPLAPRQPIDFQEPSVVLQKKQTNFESPVGLPESQKTPIVGNESFIDVKGPQKLEPAEVPDEVGHLNENNDDGDKQTEEDDFEEKPDSPAIEENVVESNVIDEGDSDLEGQNDDNRMDKNDALNVSEEKNGAEDETGRERLDGDARDNDEEMQRERPEDGDKESHDQMYEADPDQEEDGEPEVDNTDKEPVFDANDEQSDEHNDEEDEEDDNANEAATDDDYDESEETKDENNEMLQFPGRGEDEEEERPVFGAPGLKSNRDSNNDESYEEEDYEDENYDENDKKFAMEDDEKFVQDQPHKNNLLPGEDDFEEDPEDEELSDADRRHDEAVKLTER